MSRWFDPQPLVPMGDGLPNLSRAGRERALPFALVSEDVYNSESRLLNASVDGYEIRWRGSWTDIIAVAHERQSPDRLERIRVAFSKINGFNASVFQIDGGWDRCFVVAYEGTKPPNLSRKHLLGVLANPAFGLASAAADNVETIKDFLFGNSAVLDIVNKLENAFPAGLFSQFLNPDNAPSSQYEMALRVARCINALGMGEVILTGHSLGGGLAQFAAIKEGLRAVVFNSAGVGFLAASDNQKQTAHANICHIKTGFQVKGLGGTADSGFNYIVTDGSRKLSRQFGNEYLIGRGGHGMDEILQLLRAGASA